MSRKGLILSGGKGTRLYPVTQGISKQLLPVFDKPMIYYPLSTLMLAGIRDILIITTPEDLDNFNRLLGNGNKWGINISYAVQPTPDGIAQAFVIAENFIGNDSSVLVLGDNIFYGNSFQQLLHAANNQNDGATIFVYRVNDPERYGVAEIDNNKVVNIIEKPQKPISNYAVTGLYFYDNKVVDYAKSITPSDRGELEITDLNNLYLQQGQLTAKTMGRGYAWLDTGTHDSLLDAHNFVQILEKRQGLKIACIEEIAYRNKWIDRNQLKNLAQDLSKSMYGQYLIQILET